MACAATLGVGAALILGNGFVDHAEHTGLGRNFDGVAVLAGESVMVPSTALVGSVVTFIDIPGGRPLMLNSPFSPILIGVSVCLPGARRQGRCW